MSLYGLWVSSGVSLHLTPLIYDEWRLIQVVLLICVGGLMIGPTVKALAEDYYTTVVAFIWIALALASVWHAEQPSSAVLDLGLHVLLGVVAYAAMWCWRTHPGVAQAALVGLGLTLFPGLFLLALSMTQHFTNGGWMDWHGAFANPRYFDDFALAGLFAMWGIQAPRWRAILGTAQLLLGTLCFWGLLLDGARGALLAITVGLVVALATLWSKRRVLLIPVTSLVLGTACFFMFPVEMHGTVSLTRQTTSGRMELLRLAGKYFRAEPMLGIGGMGWGEFQQGGELYVDILRSQIHHPHNLLIQWPVEWGLAGWMVIVLLTVSMMKIIKRRNQIPVIAFAGLTAIVLNMMLSGAAIYPHTQLAYMLIIGWAWAFSMSPQDNEIRRYYWVRGFFTIFLGMLILVFADINLRIINSAFGMSFEPEKSRYPRYFETGRILILMRDNEIELL